MLASRITPRKPGACARYTGHLMRDGHYESLPPWWIATEWHDTLYCGNCKSSYVFGSPCYCEEEDAAAAPAVA